MVTAGYYLKRLNVVLEYTTSNNVNTSHTVTRFLLKSTFNVSLCKVLDTLEHCLNVLLDVFYAVKKIHIFSLIRTVE